MSTNSDRILRAAAILEDYDEQYLAGDCAKEQEAQNHGEGDYEDGYAYGMAVSDLLADLMHYCQRAGMDFDDRVEHARMHFTEEVEEEEAHACEWCNKSLAEHDFEEWYENDFGENLCSDCAKRCCNTCSRGLDNTGEHEDCNGLNLWEVSQPEVKALRESTERYNDENDSVVITGPDFIELPEDAACDGYNED